MSKTLKLVAVAAAATFTLAACGSDDGTHHDAGSSAGTSSSSTTSSVHNDADVTFATDMIPHHQQAVAMAKMAVSQASDPKVMALAAEIEAAQGPEISTMSGWLKAWGEEVPSTDSPRGDMGDHDMGGDMPGMMTSEQMKQLESASGAAFDRRFLDMMVEHHRGAIDMARAEQQDGRNPAAVALAKKIETAQAEEISMMESMLQRLRTASTGLGRPTLRAVPLTIWG